MRNIQYQFEKDSLTITIRTSNMNAEESVEICRRIENHFRRTVYTYQEMLRLKSGAKTYLDTHPDEIGSFKLLCEEIIEVTEEFLPYTMTNEQLQEVYNNLIPF